MTMIIDGSNGLTYPNSSTQASSSVVLQVVQTTNTATLSTASTSFATSTFSASITPKFSTSKVLILFSGQFFCAASSGGNATAYRGASNVTGGSTGLLRIQVTGGADISQSFVYLDSPATTSSTTYTLYFSTTNAGNPMYLNINGLGSGTSTITLMEIAQ
jgi:hypothetical protein